MQRERSFCCASVQVGKHVLHNSCVRLVYLCNAALFFNVWDPFTSGCEANPITFKAERGKPNAQKQTYLVSCGFRSRGQHVGMRR